MNLKENPLQGCDCKDWKEGIEQLDGFVSFAHIHQMEYTAKMFKFCPWCGKKRKEKP